jgi:hypothetical protein
MHRIGDVTYLMSEVELPSQTKYGPSRSFKDGVGGKDWVASAGWAVAPSVISRLRTHRCFTILHRVCPHGSPGDAVPLMCFSSITEQIT